MPNNVGQCFHLGMKQILEKTCISKTSKTQPQSAKSSASSNTALLWWYTTIAEKQVQLKILELPNSSRNGFASVTIVDVLGGLL